MGYWKAALVVNVAFFGTFSVIMLFSLTTVCGDWLPFMDISKIDSDSLYDFKTTVDAIARILGIETLAFLSGPLLLGADPLMFQTCFLIFVVVGIWPMVGFVFLCRSARASGSPRRRWLLTCSSSFPQRPFVPRAQGVAGRDRGVDRQQSDRVAHVSVRLFRVASHMRRFLHQARAAADGRGWGPQSKLRASKCMRYWESEERGETKRALPREHRALLCLQGGRAGAAAKSSAPPAMRIPNPEVARPLGARGDPHARVKPQVCRRCHLSSCCRTECPCRRAADLQAAPAGGRGTRSRRPPRTASVEQQREEARLRTCRRRQSRGAARTAAFLVAHDLELLRVAARSGAWRRARRRNGCRPARAPACCASAATPSTTCACST